MLQKMSIDDETLNLLMKAHQRITSLEQDNNILRKHVELLEKDHRILTDLYSQLMHKKNFLITQSSQSLQVDHQLKEQLQRNTVKFNLNQGEQIQFIAQKPFNQTPRNPRINTFSYSNSKSSKILGRKKYRDLTFPQKLNQRKENSNFEDEKQIRNTDKSSNKFFETLQHSGEQYKNQKKKLIEVRTNWQSSTFDKRSKSLQTVPNIEIIGVDSNTIQCIASQFDLSYFDRDKEKKKEIQKDIRKRCSNSLIIKNGRQKNCPTRERSPTNQGLPEKKYNYTSWRRMTSANPFHLKNHKSIVINR